MSAEWARAEAAKCRELAATAERLGQLMHQVAFKADLQRQAKAYLEEAERLEREARLMAPVG